MRTVRRRKTTPAKHGGSARVSRKLPPFDESLAGRLLAAREALIGPIRPVLREAGITEQQWRVLRVLIDQGDVDLTTIAAKALLRPPSLTRILRELTSRTLVERQADAVDARRSIVRILPAGRRIVDTTTRATLSMLDRYAAVFGSERIVRLRDELALLTEAVGPAGMEDLSD